MSTRCTFTRLGSQTVGPLLVAMGVGCGYFVVARLELPRAAILVPALLTVCGVAVTMRVNVALHSGGRPPRQPWVSLTGMTMTYAGLILFVVPALEQRKVVPEVARWVALHAHDSTHVATYRLNRWNPAFRFYVGRHTEMLDAPGELESLLEAPDEFYCVMLGPAFESFRAQGYPIQVEFEAHGMWATSGRALWRRRVPPTRFVVAARAR